MLNSTNSIVVLERPVVIVGGTALINPVAFPLNPKPWTLNPSGIVTVESLQLPSAALASCASWSFLGRWLNLGYCPHAVKVYKRGNINGKLLPRRRI